MWPCRLDQRNKKCIVCVCVSSLLDSTLKSYLGATIARIYFVQLGFSGGEEDDYDEEDDEFLYS